jgi:GEVED domain/N-terminal domain of BNR-repeat neuraminidase/Secretion system C-terminal sorting domain
MINRNKKTFNAKYMRILISFFLVFSFNYCLAQYCASSASSTADDDISNVTLNGDGAADINNNSVCSGTYSNYTALSAQVTQGSAYTVTLTLTQCSGFFYNNAASVFVDWNGDFDFVDAGENLGTVSAGPGFPSTHNIAFSVPLTSIIGTTRMRIVQVEGGTAASISSCGTYTWGETEDYTLTIVASGPMTYSSCTVVQASTATVTKCDQNQEIICVQIVTAGGSASPLVATQFIMNMTGTAGVNAASSIHVYYTGTSSTFSPINEFVTGGTAPAGGNITINGSRTLSYGTNYFWIAYDINSAATTGQTADAQLVATNSVTVAGIFRTPTANNPAGDRTINVCSAYPITSALGLKHWVKSDAGVTLTAGNVSAWADQSTAAITGNLVQGTAANRPALMASLVNFQDYIRFDGVSDILSSANTFAGNTLFSTTTNTIFMIKNYKSGLVDYKWETDPTNSYRIGMELMGSGAQRIDFVDDNGGGKNDLSTVSITNKDVLVGYVSDATTISLKLNGNTDAIKTHPSLTFSPPGATLKPLNIGANDLGNPLYCNVDIAEVMTFNKTLSVSEMTRVESYLCLKYGITMSNNKGTGSSVTYLSSDGTPVWNSQTAFHNYVIGIGRDNAASGSGLNKLKSTSVVSLNGSSDILTMANGTSLAAPSVFGTNNSYFIVGSNALTLASTATSILDLPSGITSRLERVWKAQETGTVSTVRMQFNMSTVPGVGGVLGANDLANVRLLIDADGIFATGSTIVVPSTFNNVTDLVEFQFDFTAGTGFYFTIGSVDGATAPLPVELVHMSANCQNGDARIDWTTASETNNDFYSIYRSNNATDFEVIGKVNGRGTVNTPSAYSFVDAKMTDPEAYYRISQTDFDGEEKLIGSTKLVHCANGEEILVYPNPSNANNGIYVTLNHVEKDVLYNVTLTDVTGKLLYTSDLKFSSGNATHEIKKFDSPGIYVLTLRSQETRKTKIVKLVID